MHLHSLHSKFQDHNLAFCRWNVLRFIYSSSAMQQVLDNLKELPSGTGTKEIDLIFLRGIMESPIVRSLAKVKNTYQYYSWAFQHYTHSGWTLISLSPSEIRTISKIMFTLAAQYGPHQPMSSRYPVILVFTLICVFTNMYLPHLMCYSITLTFFMPSYSFPFSWQRAIYSCQSEKGHEQRFIHDCLGCFWLFQS